MIDKATVQRIKDAADIVDVVSDYVHLTRRGANYMGLCPFHNERTPSFSVNRRRNFCYCFSCHKGGSPVNFIMEKEGVSYNDALRHLAKKYGITIEEREMTDDERRVQSEREGLLIAAEWAMKQMESDLRDTEEGRDVGLQYLYHRGVTDEAIKAFHLGYAIDNGHHLTDLMRRKGFDTDTLRMLGLTGQSQSGNLYDKYRGRVIFPIMNSSGRVVGFGGRDLKGGAAKYINSPESSLYHKNNELYGIFQAKSEIVRQNKCFLVEGYLDVISMWLSGMQNTVASSGTALTEGQIALIHRFTENVTVLYDGDSAGIKAALRGINMLLSHKMKVTVLLLPDGDDPDSFAKKHTPEEFRKYVEEHETDLIRFKIDVLSKDIGDSPMKRAEVINSVVESVACIDDDVERTVYVGECSRLLKVDESSVAAAVQRARFRIIEERKNERERRRLEKDYPADQIGPADKSPAPSQNGAAEPDSSNLSNIDAGGSDSTSGVSNSQQHEAASLNRDSIDAIQHDILLGESRVKHPLLPLEKNIIEQAIRFGYMNFKLDEFTEMPEEEDENSEEENSDEIYSVIDFIRDELEADSISFTVEKYKKVFDVLTGHFDEYLDKLEEFKTELDTRIKNKRVKGESEIAAKSASLSFDRIRREEEKLEERLQAMYNQEIEEFSRLYPGGYLASHHDDEVREVANEVVNEKYVLSKIYTQNIDPSARPEVEQIIIRAITEWKSEILNLHLKELLDQMRRESGVDEEKDREMLNKISHLMAMRSRVAKDIGDRIISPKRR